MKYGKLRKTVLEELRKTPVVEIVCTKIGISRTTFYKWRKDPEFAAEAEVAMAVGSDFISDIAEGQLLHMIKGGNFNAVSLWLRTHRDQYRNRLDVSAVVTAKREITPEEREAITRLMEAIPPVSLVEGTGQEVTNDSKKQNGE